MRPRPEERIEGRWKALFGALCGLAWLESFALLKKACTNHILATRVFVDTIAYIVFGETFRPHALFKYCIKS